MAAGRSALLAVTGRASAGRVLSLAAMVSRADKAWAGIDVGKRHHRVCVVDPDGKQLLSVKVANEEAGIEAVIGSVTGLAGTIISAVDIIGAPAALLLAVLSQADQHLCYASGRLVAAMRRSGRRRREARRPRPRRPVSGDAESVGSCSA